VRGVDPAARRDLGSGFEAHGQWFADPYAWMEHLDDAETRAWIDAQEAATRRVLDAVPGREWLRTRAWQAASHARRSAPISAGPGREYGWEADAGDEKLRLVLRPADAEPRTVLDPNRWASEEVLVFAQPSPDGSLVAFGTTVGSAHGPLIRILDVDTEQVLPDQPTGGNHASIAWLPDSTGFLFVATPSPDEVYGEAIYEHAIGSGTRRVFGGDEHPEFWCTVEVSECGRFAVMSTWDFVHATTVHLLRLADRAVLPVAPVMRSLNRVQVLDDTLLVHTDLDAPRGRLCVAPLSEPTQWRTVIAEGPDTLQSVTGVGGRLYAVCSKAASHRLHVHTADGEHLHEVTLPTLGSVNTNTGGGTVSGVSGSWHGTDVWVHFESFLQPPAVYRYDEAVDELVPYHVPEIGLDPSDYVTEQVWYESKDDTRVSMFLVHRADLPLDGTSPVRLTGYGGFNIPNEPSFTAVNAVWLQLGGVLAVANIRGGGEYGRAWHEAAIRTKRQTAFDDFVAAARWLVTAGYTTPERLIARGNSNGGLLVAVAALQAPDAFRAVFCRAPLLDMLQFVRFSHLGASTVEFGSPDDPVEGPVLAGYSPYHNIRDDRPYPVMLFATALNDRNAPPYDPVKMVARLDADASDGGPYLLLPLHASGHSGGTTRTALVDQYVDELAFHCWALDLDDVTPPIDEVLDRIGARRLGQLAADDAIAAAQDERTRR
jgi:prolyl oligopeptidase